MNTKYVPNLCLVLILTITLLLMLSCEPAFKIKIENQTQETLEVYINGPPPLMIGPGEQGIRETSTAAAPYSVVAKNTHDQVVFSREYSSRQDMQKMGNNTYKVVIPPLQNK